MINGLGVLGWGVGGIEAEAVMLGQTISFLLPEVIGYKLIGKLDSLVTSTDLVLTITKNLRQVGVVGKFVEFYGPGVAFLSIADRATISNMCPEFGGTVGFFAVDDNAIEYLRQTSKTPFKRSHSTYGNTFVFRSQQGEDCYRRAVPESNEAVPLLSRRIPRPCLLEGYNKRRMFIFQQSFIVSFLLLFDIR